MLLNFQTLCSDLTGLPMSVSSLLDESTAAAEAMQMCYSLKGKKGKKNKFLVSSNVHPQTISLIQTRAEVIGIEVIVGDHSTFEVDSGDYCGAVVKYPNTYGICPIPQRTLRGFHRPHPRRRRHGHLRHRPNVPR